MRDRDSHIFEREEHDHYVEEGWCSQRLFDEEEFYGPILDPACGWGRILQAAKDHGFGVLGSDVEDRTEGRVDGFRRLDFLGLFPEDTYEWWRQAGAIISNPPFKIIQEFANRALSLTADFFEPKKVAFIFPARRLAAATWLRETPLAKILYLTPRPSMPTGAFIKAAERGVIDPKTRKPYKVGGGTQDFCWVIWDHGHKGDPVIGWLHRDSR